MSKLLFSLSSVAILVLCISEISGHGLLVDPASRSLRLTAEAPSGCGDFHGNGVVKSYQGPEAPLTVDIIDNDEDSGYIYYEICNLDTNNGIETENCFKKNRLQFADNTDRYDIGDSQGIVQTEVRWPHDLNCEHCVLRWTFVTGSNEKIISCADIQVSVG